MTVRDSAWPEGTPCWVDLAVGDFGKAQAFYSGLFGWRIEPGPAEAGGIAVAELDGRPVAWIGPKQDPGQPTAWTPHIAVADADAAAERVAAAGGQVLGKGTDLLDVARIAVVADPAGAVFGLWQAGKNIGAGLVNVPGTLTWNEHFSADFEGSKKFYATVFGYEYGDLSADGFTYATIKLGGTDVAGIGELPADAAGARAAWSTYFGVASADEAVAKVTELGGAVVQPVRDSPYGRMAQVADDQGAPFTVIETPGK